MEKNILIIATIVFLGLFGCNNSKAEKNEYEVKTNLQDQIKRGEHLVNSIGCHDCHSPKIMTDKGPVPDPNRLLSGYNSNEVLAPYDSLTIKSYVLFNMDFTASIGPWGTSFAGNLTPDATGIGTWTEEQFLRAIKEGKLKGLEGGRPLLPPMPWEGYSHFSDQELKDIFAYLKSIKPVKNIVPLPIPPAVAVAK